MNSTAHVDESVHDKFLEVDLHGRLTRADYETFVPEIEKQILNRGTIRLLVTMHNFHGWNAWALWEEIKWDAQHFNDIQRVAIVGEKSWQKWMTGICQQFTTASVRYFTPDQLDQAREWLNTSSSGVH
jgi:hypothetical protein